MNLKHLQIFISVFENKSITRAAEQINLAQPAVSLAIKELENYYNIVLFDRMNRKIFPTSSAENFYQYATHIISLFDEMERELQDWENSGEIKIGCTVTIGQNILPHLIQKIKEWNPLVKIKTIVDDSQNIEYLVNGNKIDIGLMETTPNNDNFICIPFMSDQLCTIIGLDHPLKEMNQISLEELSTYDFLMREEGSSVSKLVSSVFSTNQLPLNISMRSISTLAIIHAVKSNIGIATLPYSLVQNFIKKDEIKTLNIPELNIERKYNIIYHKNKFISKISKEIFNICKELGNEISYIE